MFGFVVGTLCLVGFVSVWRHRGFGRGRHGRHFGHFGRGRFFGLYRVFQELDTSPGQEKAIRAAVAELREQMGELRPQVNQARQRVASALLDEHFDGASLEANLQRQSLELGRFGAAVTAALGKIHEALDPDQRRRLARVVESGPGYCF